MKTLLDEFAMHIITGLINDNYTSFGQEGDPPIEQHIAEEWAKDAYIIADAMMKERAKYVDKSSPDDLL